MVTYTLKFNFTIYTIYIYIYILISVYTIGPTLYVLQPDRLTVYWLSNCYLNLMLSINNYCLNTTTHHSTFRLYRYTCNYTIIESQLLLLFI